MSNTRVFLVRHGASGEKIAAVFASPLGRTLETASILAKPHELPIQPVDGLREISHGRWEQMTRQEVERQFPREAEDWDRDPYTFAPQGGESGLAVTARALPALMDIVRSQLGQQVLIASHKATIRLLLSSLLGFDPRRYRDNLDQSPAALNIVDFREPSRARLTLFNDTSHYRHGGLAIPAIPTARLSNWWDEEPAIGG
jgi:probable phosphoglycerate mutase